MSTIPRIKSLDQLFKNLVYGGGYDGYQGILEAIDFDVSEVEQFCHWNKEHYVRVALGKMDSFELYLNCWEKEQQTPIYDLNYVDAWIYVLQGEIIDEEYHLPEGEIPPKLYQSNVIKQGEFSETTDSMGLHKLINTFTGRSVTLHIFMDEVQKWHVYDHNSSKMKELPFESHFSNKTGL